MVQIEGSKEVNISLNKGVLPPDVDEDITFGIMWIRIGKLKLTRGKSASQNRLIVQFWGQKQPVYLQTKSNVLNKNQEATLVQYDIKCPITYFKDYLLDMKKNLKLQVENIGRVEFDITKFLKPKVDLDSRYVFDHFKGSFQIVGNQNRKIGSVQIQMACNFNPQIAALQLAEQTQSVEENSQSKVNLVQRQKIRSPGIDKQMAIEILAIQNPQLLNQFYGETLQQKTGKDGVLETQVKDQRIPNSLYTRMSDEKFDPEKYLNQQQKVKLPKGVRALVTKDRVFSIQSQNQQDDRKASVTKEHVYSIQILNQDNRQDDQQMSNFPTITKVLTYSNLKLAHQFQKDQRKNKQSKSESEAKAQAKQQLKQVTQVKDLKKQLYQQLQNQNQGLSSKNNKEQFGAIKDQLQSKKNNLANIQGQDAIKKVYLKQQSESSLLEGQKQILSRVVNLDQQLRKSEKGSPVKNKQNFFDEDVQDIKQRKNNLKNQYDIKPILQSKTQSPVLEHQKNIAKQGKYPVHQQNLCNFKNRLPSSLVLNLIIEIETGSISFYKKKQKFHLIHRPYGCKQRIKLGPKFQSDQIKIMCPVSQQLITKMDKLPFIIQFWGAVTNQFLGFVKINLSKIKKGFMLQGRLNQIAIKSSLMPIIIQKGQISIQNVNRQKSGQCSLYAAIGTSAQVQLYLNSDKKVQKRQVPNSQNKNKKQTDNKIKKREFNEQNDHITSQDKLDLKNIHLVLTNLMYYIDKNSSINISYLAQFMKRKQLTTQQFQDFLYKINQKQEKVRQIVYTFKNSIPGIDKNELKYIQTVYFRHSFDQYKQIKQSILKDFTEVNKLIQKRIPAQVKQQIVRNSSFNMIQKNKLKQIYANSLKSNLPVGQDPTFQRSLFDQYYMNFFDEYIKIEALFPQGKINFNYQPSLKTIIDKVLNHFHNVLFQHNQSFQNLQNYLDVSQKLTDLQKCLWKFCKQQINASLGTFSLWYWICLCQNQQLQKGLTGKQLIQSLKNKQVVFQKINVIKQKIASQRQRQNIQKNFNNTQRKVKPEIQKSKPDIQKIKPQVQKNESAQMTYSNIHNLLNRDDASNLIKNVFNNESINQSQQKYPENILIENQDVDVSNSQLGDNKQKGVQYYEHSFKIRGLQLFLQFPFDGQCQLNYMFPFDDEPIASKKIRVFKNKHRYAINLYGQHRITIEDDIHSYLNQIPLKFQLVNVQPQQNNRIILQGDLHPDELLLESSSLETKVVPLFGEDVQKVEGKVKLQISYQFKYTQKENLGKQTVYNLFLPKSGFVNFSFQVKLQSQKIKSQYHLHEEEFYVAIVIDFFNESKNLKHQYPLISSNLYSNLEEQIDFRSSLKLNLNPTVLDYLKQKTCSISMNVVYYSKEKGNYEKKQIVFGTLKIPLFNLIKDEGVEGNYAFKNKYGMFVGLCRSKMKYEKHQKKDGEMSSQTQLGMTSPPNRGKLTNYWVIIHFKQLINFQENLESTFVKFQTIFNGTKYQTQKINLSDDPLVLFSDFIALNFTQEQFFATKIIPVSLQLDKKQKLAMDVSLKPISRKLNKQKHFVSGGYFLVVNEDSQLTRVRVGARVIVFKGTSLIQPFVTALCNNINVDILSQIDLKRDLENYSKLLQIFRGQLKLSKRAFDDCLKQLLTNRNQRLPMQLMSSQIKYRLDLTPIIAKSQDELDSLVRNTQGIINQDKLFQLVKQNGYQFTNFHPQIVKQYSFEHLWTQKIDKNVQYFNLKGQVDLLALARKVKVVQNQGSQQIQEERKYKQLRITVQRGINFHYLYNGIKPNVMVKFPQLSYQSKTKPRSSQPLFNQSLREIIQPQNESMFRALDVEVYHVANDNRKQQEILIGSGVLNVFGSINLSGTGQSAAEKQAKVVISSAMSSKMKATLEVRLQLRSLSQNQYEQRGTQANHQNVLEDASLIQQMIKDINKDMNNKKHLFQQSSSDQY